MRTSGGWQGRNVPAEGIAWSKAQDGGHGLFKEVEVTLHMVWGSQGAGEM